jgi:hypothetical protein
VEHLIVQLFKPILAYSSQEDLVAYLFKHPVLMSPYYTELLEGWAATLSGPQQSIALRCIALNNERPGD